MSGAREDGLRLPPARLFKYRSLPRPKTEEEEHRRAEIVESQLYFAPPSELNDPFDCKPSWTLDASPGEIEDYVSSGPPERMGSFEDSELATMMNAARKRWSDESFVNSVWESGWTPTASTACVKSGTNP